MNRVQKLLLDIKMAEAKLEYTISRGDDDETPRYIAGWSYSGDFMLYTQSNLIELSPNEAKRFAQWILSMLGEEE